MPNEKPAVHSHKQQVPNNTRAIKMTTDPELETEPERLDEDPEEQTIDTAGPIRQIFEGVIISLLFGLIIGGPIYLFTSDTEVNLIGSIFCGLWASVWFFTKGVNPSIETAFLGAIKCADERVYDKQNSEGWSWMFPWIYSHQPVSAIEKTITVGSDDDPLEILAVKDKEAGEDTDARQIVALTGKFIIRIKVWSAPLSLGFEYPMVEKNVVNYVNSTLRQIASRSEKGYVDFATNRHQIANRVFQDFKRVLHEANNGETKTYSQQVESMGYRTVDVEFVKIDLPAAVKKAAEGQAIEEAERKKDLTEVETYQMMCQKVRGEGTDLSDTEVSNRALLLMGKPVNIYEGVGGGSKLLLTENQTETGGENK